MRKDSEYIELGDTGMTLENGVLKKPGKPVPEPCKLCGQIDTGQYGEYPCPKCGLPMVHNDDEEWDH